MSTKRQSQHQTIVSTHRIVESIIGKETWINPEFEGDETVFENNFDIDWQQKYVTLSKHDMKSICEWCTKFHGACIIYDISADIIMDRNQWCREKITVISSEYVYEWMNVKCNTLILIRFGCTIIEFITVKY